MAQPTKTKLDKLQVGDLLSETQYYTVLAIHNVGGRKMVQVQNERGFEFSIGGSIIEEGMFSSSQYENTVELTQTELVEVFSKVGDSIFTVTFNKQPKAKEINEAISKANKGKILPIKEIQKLVTDAYKGEERVLVGYLLKTETGFGRSTVIDLKAPKEHRIRQVDHRTIKSLIHQGVLYKVK